MEEKTVKKDSKTGIVKRVISIVGNVVLYIIFGLSIILLAFSIISKQSTTGGVNIFGHQVLNVITPSMEKCDATDVSNFEIKDIKVNSLVCVENVPTEEKEKQEWYSKIKVGDVLTFRYFYFEQETITHRVINIEEKEGGYIFTMAGDNKDEDSGVGEQVVDTTLEGTPNFIVGKVVWVNYPLGALLTVFKSQYGLIFVVIVPCTLICVFEIGKIISYFVKRNKEKVMIESEKKSAEIEELKRQIEEIKASKNSTTEESGGEE